MMVCQINSVKDELVVAWIDGMASQIGCREFTKCSKVKLNIYEKVLISINYRQILQYQERRKGVGLFGIGNMRGKVKRDENTKGNAKRRKNLQWHPSKKKA